MGFWDLIALFIKLLPEITLVVKGIMTVVKDLETHEQKAYVKQVGDAISELSKSLTNEDKQAAAKGVADAIANLK